MKQKIQIKYLSVFLLSFFFLSGCQPAIVPDPGLEPLKPVENKIESEQQPVVETPEVVPKVKEENPDDVFEELKGNFELTAGPDELDTNFVKQRYQLYKGKEEKWLTLVKETSSLGVGFEQPELFGNCYQMVHFLAEGYQRLQSESSQGYFATSKYDIRFLSENCDMVFGVQAVYLPTMLGSFKEEAANEGRAIVHYYDTKHDFHHIVQAVENLQDLIKGDLDPELNLVYGRALVRMGRLEDAARVLSQVVQGLDFREQWSLRLEIAELLIASGEYEKARNQYLAIAEVLSSCEETHNVVTSQLALLYATDDHTTEIALYSQCLHAYLSFDGHSVPVELEQNLQHLQKKYPEGIHALAAMRLYQQAEEQVRNDVASRLLHVQEVADARQFQHALDELKEMKQARIPDDALARIDEMIVVVKKARATYIQQEKEKRIQARVDRWQEGLNLLDMQMYDESIAVFSGLLGTEYDSRAVKEISKASELAAIALRKKAAGLFVRARRTKDDRSRSVFLKQSRGLLQEILDKYPQVELIEKVAINLAVIDEQLQELKYLEE